MIQLDSKMKLAELFEERDTIKAYSRALKQAGIQKLGSGYFSDVFQHPEFHNVVVKLIKKQDDGYLRWVKFAQENLGNPWVPKIADISAIKMADGEIKAVGARGSVPITLSADAKSTTHLVFLERLKPATKTVFDRFVRELRSQVDGLDPNPQLWGPEDWEELAITTKDRKLKKVFSFFAKQPMIDLHLGNVMLDENNHLVFSDPLS